MLVPPQVPLRGSLTLNNQESLWALLQPQGASGSHEGKTLITHVHIHPHHSAGKISISLTQQHFTMLSLTVVSPVQYPALAQAPWEQHMGVQGDFGSVMSIF